MYLSELLKKSLPVDCKITGLTLDSRQVKPDYLFVALNGSDACGEKFIKQAIERGAKAVFVEASPSRESISMEQSIPIIPVPDLNKKLHDFASIFFGYPDKALKIIGVTGTSGKTSCTHFLTQMLEEAGVRCGIIGTLGYGEYGKLQYNGFTTPDAISLQKIFHEFVKQGLRVCAMEVSSHSIHQGRISKIDFQVGVFTNLSHDHLDYHGNMENYAQVKRSFLADLNVKKTVINADDRWGRQWINEISKYKPVFAYSINPPQPAFEKAGQGIILHQRTLSNFTYAEDVKLSEKGVSAKIISPWGRNQISLPLVGLFNLSNALAVITTLCAYGLAFEDVIKYASHLKPVPGRMQMIGGQSEPLVVVDYAHKPDALSKVLETLRHHIRGKLLCVFGCGGERDQSKRPVMAKIAEHFADKVIVTQDNPRKESPENIIKEIMNGFAHPERIIVEPDRSKAIQKGIQLARASDCVLIAGKGAEHFQLIGDQTIPFDDLAEAKKYLDCWEKVE